MVDFIKPRIEQIELTQDEKNYDNTNKTKTLKIFINHKCLFMLKD